MTNNDFDHKTMSEKETNEVQIPIKVKINAEIVASSSEPETPEESRPDKSDIKQFSCHICKKKFNIYFHLKHI